MPSEHPDHDSPPDDHAEDEGNGVLSDAASIDTTGIGILGVHTAQVSVSLPNAEGRFGDDDDLIDHAIVADEVEILGEADVDAEEPDQEQPHAEPLAPPAGGMTAPEELALPEEPALPEEFALTEDVSDEPIEATIDEEEPPAGSAPDTETPSELEGDSSIDALEDEVAREGDPADEVATPEQPEATASIPTSRREAHQTGPTARTHEVARVQQPPSSRVGVTLTSRRLGEFHADRESADLLTADRLLDHGKLARPEPEGAWQHFVYALSGGRINLGDGRRARARKDLDRQIAAPLSGGARFVPVLSRKGGVGKTTVTTLLGMALADARDDRVIAVDANPDRGTLADRLQRPSGKTVRDLVRAHDDVTGYNDISTIVARDETRLDVLASDTDPRVSEAFNDRDYQDVAEIAAHYYSIVLTDTGTGIVHSVMDATLALADQLVVVSGLSVDEARLASETLTWLEANGFEQQVRNAVVVLNNSRPGAPLVRQEELEAHFGTRVRAVVRMPYDPHIATGSAIVFRDLRPATREAARALAVAVIEGLRSLAVAA